MERLEPEFLQQAEVITDGKLFEKKINKVRTNMLYKQTKFNLLREESEGYSKLLVCLLEHLVQPLDYYWTSSSPQSHQVIAEQRLSDIEEKTTIVIQNITSLIGTFDLDPNRVLDIVLDAFISNCLDHW